MSVGVYERHTQRAHECRTVRDKRLILPGCVRAPQAACGRCEACAEGHTTHCHARCVSALALLCDSLSVSVSLSV
jgi:hypothetical protein